MKQIKIPGANYSIVVPVADIIRIEAASNYSRVYFADGTQMVVSKVLQWFQNLLPEDLFVRVHRSHLVNKSFVKAINGNDNKTLQMNTGEFIVVSRRRKDLMQNVVQQ
jgi:two-component system LytT family response regulator